MPYKLDIPLKRSTFLVTKDNTLKGFIHISSIQSVPKQKWSKTTIKKLISPISFHASPKDDAFHLLNVMINKKLSIVPVIDKKKLVGAVDLSSLIRYVKIKSLSD